MVLHILNQKEVAMVIATPFMFFLETRAIRGGGGGEGGNDYSSCFEFYIKKNMKRKWQRGVGCRMHSKLKNCHYKISVTTSTMKAWCLMLSLSLKKLLCQQMFRTFQLKSSMNPTKPLQIFMGMWVWVFVGFCVEQVFECFASFVEGCKKWNFFFPLCSLLGQLFFMRL